MHKIVRKSVLLAMLFSVVSVNTSVPKPSRLSWGSFAIGAGIGIGVASVGGAFLLKKFKAKFVQAPPDYADKFICISEHEKGFADFIGQEVSKERASHAIRTMTSVDECRELGLSKCKGIFVGGSKGNGKTLLVNVIAKELNAHLVPISGYDLAKMGDDQRDYHVKELVQFAKGKLGDGRPVVVFCDDFHQLAKGRNQELVAHNIEKSLSAVSQEENIFFVFASEDEGVFTNSFLRRNSLEKIVLFHPNRESKKEILKHYMGQIKLSSGLSVDELVEKWSKLYLGYDGTVQEIKNFVKEAASIAFLEGDETVKEKHFYVAENKMFAGVKSNASLNKEDLRSIAIHEAGHALTSLLKGKRVPQVNVIHRERYNGMAYYLYEREHCHDRPILESKIMTSLGGFCAENFILGSSTMGVSGDLETANDTAREMVTRYGMGDGLLCVTERAICSDAMRAKLDSAVLAILNRCRERTTNLLEENKDLLLKLADALVEKKILLEEEIYELVGRPRKQTGSYE